MFKLFPPSPKELGWTKYNGLPIRKYKPEDRTWEDWYAHVKKHYPVRFAIHETWYWFDLNVIDRFYRVRSSIKFAYQRARYGFDDRELYNMDISFAKWLLPRIKRFRKKQIGHPHDLTEEEWNLILEKIQAWAEWMVSDDRFLNEPPLDIQEGFDLFHKWCYNIWI